MDKASATETVDLGSLTSLVKPKTAKLVFIASLLNVQQLKGQGETFTVSLKGGCLTQSPKGHFVVSWLRQLGELNIITITYQPQYSYYTGHKIVSVQAYP